MTKKQRLYWWLLMLIVVICGIIYLNFINSVIESRKFIDSNISEYVAFAWLVKEHWWYCEIAYSKNERWIRCWWVITNEMKSDIESLRIVSFFELSSGHILLLVEDTYMLHNPLLKNTLTYILIKQNNSSLLDDIYLRWSKVVKSFDSKAYIISLPQ